MGVAKLVTLLAFPDAVTLTPMEVQIDVHKTPLNLRMICFGQNPRRAHFSEQKSPEE